MSSTTTTRSSTSTMDPLKEPPVPAPAPALISSAQDVEDTSIASFPELARATDEKSEDEPISQAAAETPPPEFNPSWRFYMIFIFISILTLAVALDATSISVALPIITDELNGTAIEAFWSGTSFLLTSTVFQPIYASMSHVFGRKLMFYVAIAFFTAGAIVAAVANSFTALLVGRVLQGIGGGGLFPLSEILVTDLVPLRQRGQWFGFLSGMWAIGSVSGPIVGGAFAQSVTWRWIFWINLPLIGIGLILMTIFLKLNLLPGSIVEKLKRYDWIGAGLFIASTTSFLIPITWGGISYPWDSWHTLVPLVLGVAGIVLFLVYERFFSTKYLLPLSIFNNWTTRSAYFQTVIHGMILWSLLYYLPLYYEAVKGYTPIITGVALFPETFTVAPASIAVGIAVTITGRYRWALWSGWFITILGVGLLNLMSASFSTPGWILVNLVTGLGTGILYPAMQFAIQAAVPASEQAFATAFYSFFRSFGQGIGVAVGGVIFQNSIRQKILSYPLIAHLADQYSADATALVRIISEMEDGESKELLKVAYADSIKTIWIAMCVLAAVAGLASLAVKSFTLDQELETLQGFDHGKKTEDLEKKVDNGFA